MDQPQSKFYCAIPQHQSDDDGQSWVCPEKVKMTDDDAVVLVSLTVAVVVVSMISTDLSFWPPHPNMIKKQLCT